MNLICNQKEISIEDFRIFIHGFGKVTPVNNGLLEVKMLREQELSTGQKFRSIKLAYPVNMAMPNCPFEEQYEFTTPVKESNNSSVYCHNSYNDALKSSTTTNLSTGGHWEYEGKTLDFYDIKVFLLGHYLNPVIDTGLMDLIELKSVFFNEEETGRVLHLKHPLKWIAASKVIAEYHQIEVDLSTKKHITPLDYGLVTNLDTDYYCPAEIPDTSWYVLKNYTCCDKASFTFVAAICDRSDSDKDDFRMFVAAEDRIDFLSGFVGI